MYIYPLKSLNYMYIHVTAHYYIKHFLLANSQLSSASNTKINECYFYWVHSRIHSHLLPRKPVLLTGGIKCTICPYPAYK